MVDIAGKPSAGGSQPISVLIVDEHVLFREGLERLLSSEPDFRVVGQVGWLPQAVERVLSLKPDLVLMDVAARDGDGLEVVREIALRCPESAVVVLTVLDSDEVVFGALRAGARGYLHKDTPLAQLLAALRTLRQGETILARHLISRLVHEFSQDGQHGDLHLGELGQLTAREREVLRHLQTGATNQEIAERLVISEYTVKAHVHHILAKLKLRNRAQAAHFASERLEPLGN